MDRNDDDAVRIQIVFPKDMVEKLTEIAEKENVSGGIRGIVVFFLRQMINLYEMSGNLIKVFRL